MGSVGFVACTVAFPSAGWHTNPVGGMPSGVLVLEGGVGIMAVYSELPFSPGWIVGTSVPFPIDCGVALMVALRAYSCWV
jgi:hypothetical protein